MFNMSSTKSGSFLVAVFSILLCVFLFAPVTVSEAIDPCSSAGDTSQTGPTFTVTRTDDTDNFSCCVGSGGAPIGCSLREAINAANSYVGTATINATELEATINLGSTLPTITNSITLNGAGQTIDASTIPGGGRILHINAPGQTVAMNGLELTGGNFGIGAAILVANGTVNLAQSVIHDNSGDEGVGIAIDAAAPVNTVTISETSFANNTSGVVDPTSASVIRNSGATTISKSTISGNSGGVPILNFDTAGSSLTLTNSTISGNDAPITSVIDNEGGAVTISYSTIADNLTLDEFSNGALYTNGGTITTAKSIIANNNNDFSGTPDSSCVSAGGGSFVDSGYNIESGNSCGFAGTSMSATDPILAGLGDNGGPTETMALLDGSPALDVISTPCGVAADQRGASRPYNVKCDIGAYESTLSYSINAAVLSGSGSISPVGATTVLRGGSQTYTITPDPGYQISNVVVNGVSVGTPSSFTFTNVKTNYSIYVYFSSTQLTITAMANPNGSITNPGANSYARNSSPSFTVTANSGFRISNIVIDGVSIGTSFDSPYTHTFTNITSNHSITATFAPNTYRIRIIHSGGGTIKIPGGENIVSGTDISVTLGGSKTFNITPNNGNSLIRIEVNGVSQGSPASFSFSDVRRDYVLVAYFGVSISISVNNSSRGSITNGLWGTVTSTTPVTRTAYVGGNYKFTVAAAAGDHISSIVVNGEAIGGIPQTAPFLTTYDHTLTSVSTTTTIIANFSPDTYPITATLNGGHATMNNQGVTNVAVNTDQAYTINTDDGYFILSVVVDGIADSSLPSGATTFSKTFSNVTAGHSLIANIAPNTYPITATLNGGHATMNDQGVTNVPRNADKSYTVTADAGYRILSVIIDGTADGTIGANTTTYSKTFSNVTSAHSIVATIISNLPYFIRAGVMGGNGAISPSGTIYYAKGTNIDYVVTPDPGWKITNVVVNGTSVGAPYGATYTHHFINLGTNYSIYAYFAPW